MKTSVAVRRGQKMKERRKRGVTWGPETEWRGWVVTLRLPRPLTWCTHDQGTVTQPTVNIKDTGSHEPKGSLTLFIDFCLYP